MSGDSRNRRLERVVQQFQDRVGDKIVDSGPEDGEVRCAGTDKTQDAVEFE